jgi:small subunit ribosomal protein S6
MMAVLAPDIPDEQMPAALDRVAGFVTTYGGEVTSLNTTTINALTLGRRRLAYPIRKYRDGFYALYHFNLEPLQVEEIERELRLNTQVLRHLITVYTPPKAKKPKKGEAAAAEAAAAEAAAAPVTIAANGTVPTAVAPATSASGADVDTDAPVPPAPDGTELNEPPTAETPEPDDE